MFDGGSIWFDGNNWLWLFAAILMAMITDDGGNIVVTQVLAWDWDPVKTDVTQCHDVL